MLHQTGETHPQLRRGRWPTTCSSEEEQRRRRCTRRDPIGGWRCGRGARTGWRDVRWCVLPAAVRFTRSPAADLRA